MDTGEAMESQRLNGRLEEGVAGPVLQWVQARGRQSMGRFQTLTLTGCLLMNNSNVKTNAKSYDGKLNRRKNISLARKPTRSSDRFNRKGIW